MEKRTQKQLVIGLIFVLIVGGVSYGFVDYFFLIEATCFDKVKNQLEEGVDCGLIACGVVCEPEVVPLEVKFQKLLKIREGDYDFIAQVYNPNSVFGASRAKYSLDLVGGNGTQTNKTGVIYLAPGQTRYLIIPNIKSDDILTNASVDIEEVEWVKVQLFENIEFPIQRKSYTVLKKNGVFSELEAVILNNSDFDFDKVEVSVVLSDDNGNIVAVNRTDIRTFLSKTERYFKVSWPTELPANISTQNIEVLTNVFENSNFLKKYGTQERFQKYY